MVKWTNLIAKKWKNYVLRRPKSLARLINFDKLKIFNKISPVNYPSFELIFKPFVVKCLVNFLVNHPTPPTADHEAADEWPPYEADSYTDQQIEAVQVSKDLFWQEAVEAKILKWRFEDNDIVFFYRHSHKNHFNSNFWLIQVFVIN